MRRKSSTFFLFDVAFLANAHWRKLAKRLPDPDDFNSAVGAYIVALAAARGNGLPDLDVVAETESRFVADLIEVGLLTPTGFPQKPWSEYAPARPSYPSDERAPSAPSAPSAPAPSAPSAPSAPHHSVPSIPLPSSNREDVPRTENVSVAGSDTFSVETWATLAELSEEMTGKPYALGQPTSKLGVLALQQVEDYGWDAVESAWRKAQEILPLKPRPSIGQIVLSADNFLRPIPRIDGKAVAAAERADEEDAAHRRRLEQTQRMLADLRGTV